MDEAVDYAENLGDCDHPFEIEQVITVHCGEIEEVEDEE